MTNILYRENALTVDAYLLLQRKMGDAEDPRHQAEKSLAHQIYSVAVYENGEIIGMGRLLGDWAIYWYINDVRVVPERQGMGIGKEIVRWLVDFVRRESLPGTSVSLCLMCARGKEGFYEKLGFLRRPHGWEGAGMEMEIDIPEASC